jgi:hypothetical protein
MFIKLHFRCSVAEPQLRIIKVSRIQEVRPPTYDRWGAQVQLSGDKKFHDVVENIDEIFGIIAPSAKTNQPSDESVQV